MGFAWRHIMGLLGHINKVQQVDMTGDCLNTRIYAPIWQTHRKNREIMANDGGVGVPVSCKGKNSMIVWYGAFCEETSCNTFAMNYLWLEFVVQKDDPMKTYIRTYSNQPFTSGFITSWISTELENSKSRHLPSISHPLGGCRCWPNELWFDAFLSTIGLL